VLGAIFTSRLSLPEHASRSRDNASASVQPCTQIQDVELAPIARTLRPRSMYYVYLNIIMGAGAGFINKCSLMLPCL
jgi:hypothetical protein